MAIDTNDKKLAVMEMDVMLEPGLVLDETSPFDQGNKQQLLWGYPGILWLDLSEIEVTGIGVVYFSNSTGVVYVSNDTGTVT